MNWQHFRAILWLRWRTRVNQLRKGGTAQVVIMAIVAMVAVLAGVGFFFGAFIIGQVALAQASPIVLMAVWDGMVIVFLFSWTAGVVAELQRTESLSLEKLLHFPLSLAGAFATNYLASLVSLSMIVFFPALAGLGLGLVFSKGPIMLWLIPLLAAFMLMVTALTYQFQGWLASLMQNKRRRRTVIVVVTASIILVGQLPNLISIYSPWRSRSDLFSYGVAEETSREEYNRRQGALNRPPLPGLPQAANLPRSEPDFHRLNQNAPMIRLINAILPPGWLPLGAMSLAEGSILPSLLGTLGLTLIGLASLRRSYRTTVGLYTGRFSAGKRSVAEHAPSEPIISAPKTKETPARFLEIRLPGLSEHTSAIALAAFRSLLRAPETKLMLLTPIIMVFVLGGMMIRNSTTVAASLRPLLAFGAMAMILLGKGDLLSNQFGFDRNGFRVFILCPARRWEILLGKNLALAPLVLGLGVVLVGIVQLATPMRIDLFIATFPQLVSMYFVACLLANFMSIMAPRPVGAGVFRSGHQRWIPFAFHLAFIFVYPACLAPMLLPLAIESILEDLHMLQGVPVCLILSIVECIGVLYFYRFILGLQGQLLQSREKKILETVTSKAE